VGGFDPGDSVEGGLNSVDGVVDRVFFSYGPAWNGTGDIQKVLRGVLPRLFDLLELAS